MYVPIKSHSLDLSFYYFQIEGARIAHSISKTKTLHNINTRLILKPLPGCKEVLIKQIERKLGAFQNSVDEEELTEKEKKLTEILNDLEKHDDYYSLYEDLFFTDAYLECQARHYSLTIYHPVGTCKMGPDEDEMAVVNHRLKVRSKMLSNKHISFKRP